MIPIQLHIKNFLSYGSDIQTINFEPYHLICLSGKNGHGKSALLDAITWALWGQARKVTNVAKADQGLLRLGQTQMMVTLDFICNGHNYRVRREYAQTYGKPLANLDFGICDDGDYRALTGKTIRETQATIEKTINLDYESFINSAFLRQGQSNEFSKKSSKERKEVLATILGLNSYESIKRLALEKMRLSTQQKATLTALHEKVSLELAQSAALEQRLQILEKELTTLKDTEASYTTAYQAFEQNQRAIAAAYKERDLLHKTVQELKKTEQETIAALHNDIAAWRTYERLRRQTHDSALLEARKKELMDALTSTQTMVHQHLQVKEQYLQQKSIIQQLEQELHNQKQQLIHTKQLALERARYEVTQAQTQITTIAQEEINYHAELAKLNHEEQAACRQQGILQKEHATREAQEKQFEKRKAHYHQWVALGNVLSAELEGLRKKHALVSDDAPSCPLCEQNLSASRRRFLKTKFGTDDQMITHRINRLSGLIKKLKELLLAQHEHIALQRKQDQELSVLTAAIETLKKNQEIIRLQCQQLQATREKYEKQLQQATTQISDITKALQEAQATQEVPLELHNHRLSLEVLEQALATYKHDPQMLQKLNEQLQEIDHLLKEHQSVTHQIALQEERKKSVHAHIMQIRQQRDKQKQLHADIQVLEATIAQEKTLKPEDERLRAWQQQIITQKETLLREKGGLENQAHTLRLLAREQETYKTELGNIDTTIADFQAIAQATGKDGIQALLIEETIPEIEQEANFLLAKLTDNQTQLFIESLRDLKKGGTKETLDIKISDAAGIRPYELFSGGEAFRIDFALRIAISKLLARRAGASLQTLIIDEGFGSQDEEGLGHIMDALYKIQDDFTKIIIVSHLPAMKDQFPVHFVVEKGAQGSTIRTVEQG